MSAAIYIRVSTTKKTPEDQFRQSLEVQRRLLEEYCEKQGWPVATYEDRMSGANPNRPHFKRLMEDARRGKFGVVLVWKFDRFARSLKELIFSMDEFRELGIRFVSLTEALDTGTSLGRMIFGVVGALAEFERDLLRERVQAGVDHAKEHGTRSGLAIGRPKAVVRRDEIRRLKAEGVPVREIARQFKIGIGTVYRACSVTPAGNPGGPIAPGGA